MCSASPAYWITELSVEKRLDDRIKAPCMWTCYISCETTNSSTFCFCFSSSDENQMLKFPSTRAVLWDHKCVDTPVHLHISYYRYTCKHYYYYAMPIKPQQMDWAQQASTYMYRNCKQTYSYIGPALYNSYSTFIRFHWIKLHTNLQKKGSTLAWLQQHTSLCFDVLYSRLGQGRRFRIKILLTNLRVAKCVHLRSRSPTNQCTCETF